MTCPYCAPAPEGSAVFILEHGVILHGGREVRLTPRQAALLGVLAKHPGSVVHPDRLIPAIWPEREPRLPEDCLKVHLSQLRRRLPAGFGIENRHGFGYRLHGRIEVRSAP